MGAEGAVAILYRKELQKDDSEQTRQEKIKEYRETFSNPYYSASKQFVDAVIQPQETRIQLIKLLEMLRSKHETSIPKKHGNIPL